MKDQIYRSKNPNRTIAPFEFNQSVAEVFEDMIRRSVPGYGMNIELAMVLAARTCNANDHIYDLGCSLGAVSLALLNQSLLPQLKITAVDNAQPMLDGFSDLLTKQGLEQSQPMRFDYIGPQHHQLQLVNADITRMVFKPCKLVLLNYVLQFLSLSDRTSLLQRLYDQIRPGGCLVLAEKIVQPCPIQQQQLDELHVQFKRLQGYSEMEIAGKRSALEHVLIPEPLEIHTHRLKSVGFKQVNVVMSYLNFATLVAEK